MNEDLEALVLTVAAMRADENAERVNVRNIGARLGIHFSTVQNHIKRACDAGYLQYTPGRSNTLRLGPGITVHDGEVYQMVPIGAAQ